MSIAPSTKNPRAGILLSLTPTDRDGSNWFSDPFCFNGSSRRIGKRFVPGEEGGGGGGKAYRKAHATSTRLWVLVQVDSVIGHNIFIEEQQAADLFLRLHNSYIQNLAPAVLQWYNCPHNN